MIERLTPTREGIGPSEERTARVLANMSACVAVTVGSYIAASVLPPVFAITLVGIVLSAIWALEALYRLSNRYYTRKYE